MKKRPHDQKRETGFSTILLIILILLAIVAMRNTIAKTVIEKVARKKAEIKLVLDGVDISLSKSTVELKGLEVYDREKPSLRLLYAPLILADYDLVSCLKGHPHLTLLKIDIEEITVARKRKGKLTLNMESLGKIKEKIKSLAKKGKSEGEKGKVNFRIDKLILTLKRVRFIDYTKPIPEGKVINVDIRNEIFENVDNPKTLIASVVMKALVNMGISGLKNLGRDLKSKGTEELPEQLEKMKRSPGLPENLKKEIKNILRKL